jgi:hypothetical protein
MESSGWKPVVLVDEDTFQPKIFRLKIENRK